MPKVALIVALILGTLTAAASFGQRFIDNKSAVKVLGIISIVALIIAGVLFFLLHTTCSLPDKLPDISEYDDLPSDFILPDIRKSAFSPGFGAIIGGVLALLSAACSAVAVFVPDKD